MSVEYTYNICGIYNANGEEHLRKARVRFRSKTIASKYDTNMLFDVCQNWLNRNYPRETLSADEFDLDCEGEYETADNSDIIIAL